ncbi:MAG: DUF2378 family protein [Myxococcota bacterium]|nr:DUF2378 family protein [Myxococcota bacterium]
MSQAAEKLPTPPTPEEVVFDNTVDGLFRRALGRRMSHRCKERLKAAGLDLDAKLKPAYPRLQYYDFVNIAAEELYGGMSRDAAHFELGKQFIAGFQETLLGKAVTSLVKLLGPRKTLGKMSQNMQSSNNYMKTSLKELGPGDCEITLSQVSGAPRYFEGVLLLAIELTGGAEAKVRPTPGEGPSYVYHCTWKDKAK